MVEVTVEDGDCFASLSVRNGFTWQRLWEHPANAALRELRGEATILLPGDVVRIPDPQFKEEESQTDGMHRFVIDGGGVLLQLRLLLPTPEVEQEAYASPDDQCHNVEFVDPSPGRLPAAVPWKYVPYQLAILGVATQSGRTDADGRLSEIIDATVRVADLVINPATSTEVRLRIAIGALDPADTTIGAAGRLSNLGYWDCSRPTEKSAAFGHALALFQMEHELGVTGELDEDTREKLKQLNGS